MALELVRVAREDHWQAYHHIRRHVLYELRGREGYDDKHPDEHRGEHIPFLYLESGNPVGTVRFDLESEGHAVVRLVAVLPARQRQGLGRAMMAALENVAIEKGVRRLRVHSAPDAVPFYEKLGWTMIDATADYPLMMKELPVADDCMNLPDLPPDLSFPRLGMSPAEIDFAFEVKRAAMGPHVTKRWGWDEAFQRNLHQRHYEEKPFFEIRRAEQRLGTLSFQVLRDHVRFGEFYLFPEHQRQGMGSAILIHFLTVSDRLKLPVRLEHLHWNPVGSLYRRHGFAEVGRSEIHCFMERPPTLT